MSRLRTPAAPTPLEQRSLAHLQAPTPAHSTPPSLSGASTSSRLSSSLSTAFTNLSPSDINFFDQVISRVRTVNAYDLPSLKRAYNHTRAIPLPLRCTAERDAHLWNTTLMLLKVRGLTWREKWNNVKLSLGLHQEQEATSETASERATTANETGQRTQDFSETHSHATESNRPRLSEAQRNLHRARDVKWKAVDGSSSSSDASTTSDQTAQPVTSRAEQMDLLAAKARALSLATSNAAASATSKRREEAKVAKRTSSARPARPKLPPTNQLRTTYVESEVSSSSSDEPNTAPHARHQTAAPVHAVARRARFSEPPVQQPVQQQQQRRESSPTPPPYDVVHPSTTRAAKEPLLNALDRLSLAQQRQVAPTVTAPVALPPTSSTTAAAMAADVQRTQREQRLDTVLARSRAERAALARAEAARLVALEEAQYAHLTALADAHYARTQLKPALQWWVRRTDRVTSRQQNAHRAGQVVLLSRVWRAWKARVQEERTRREEADSIGKVRCTLTAWRIWKRRMTEREERRREERLGVLREAYAAVKRRREERIRTQTWSKWRSSFHAALGLYFRKAHLLRGALSVWQLATLRNRRLRAEEDHVVQQKRQWTLGEAWDTWRRRAKLRIAERAVQEGREVRLSSETWELWKKTTELNSLARAFSAHRIQRSHLHIWQGALAQRTTQRRKEALADRWRARRTKRYALHSWFARLRVVQALNARGAQLLAVRQTRLAHATLKTWMLAERGALLLRKNHAVLVQLVLHEWNYQFRKLVDLLRQHEQKVTLRLDAGALRRTWETWLLRLQLQREDALLASKRDARLTLTKTFARWRERKEDVGVRSVKADILSEYVCERAAFATWKVALRERRVQKVAARRERQALRNTLSVWRVRTTERAQERLAVAHMRSKIEERLTHYTLLIWTQRVIELRSRCLLATERADGKAKDKAWMQWRAAYDRHCDLDALALSFLDVKREDWTRRIFAKWLLGARAERKRRLMADAMLEQRTKEVVLRAWNTWSERYAEATLRPLEYEVMVRRQDRVVQGVMAQWQAKTRVLPALRFDHARLYKHAWEQWLTALPLAADRRRAAQIDKLGMLGKAFRHWVRAAKTKRSVRAAARFGGPSMIRLRNAALAKRAGPFTRGSSSSPLSNKPASAAAPQVALAIPRHMREATSTPTPATGPTNALEMSSSNISSLFDSPSHARRSREPPASLAQLASLTTKRRRSLSPAKHAATPARQAQQQQTPRPPSRVATGSAVPLGDATALRRWVQGVATSSSMPQIPPLPSTSDSDEESHVAPSHIPPGPRGRVARTPAPSSAPSRQTPRARSHSPPSPVPSRAARSELTARPIRPHTNRESERERQRVVEELRERERAKEVLAALRARRRERVRAQPGGTSNEE